MLALTDKVVVTGTAGLVGQDLVRHLKIRGHEDIVALDKHPRNMAVLRAEVLGIEVIDAGLTESGEWEGSFEDATRTTFLDPVHSRIELEF